MSGSTYSRNAIDPAKTTGSAGLILELLYDRLVSIGADGLPKPWLAESWQIADAHASVGQFRVECRLVPQGRQIPELDRAGRAGTSQGSAVGADRHCRDVEQRGGKGRSQLAIDAP